ncbi:MAG: flagellar biosynthesis regulator FlaF [Hyphomicrobiales bacterium]|nr:flagellar biosynthesis regulator FlaF [Hyphomicrobiales bacterium]
MYQFSYAEILDDTPAENRKREQRAFERCIELLGDAQKAGAKSRQGVEAITFTNRLWSLLMEDLAKPENYLPNGLKAELISVGIWIMGELDRLRQGKTDDFSGLIEVSNSIAAGLAQS